MALVAHDISFDWDGDGLFAEPDTVGALWPWTLTTMPYATVADMTTVPSLELEYPRVDLIDAGVEAERGRNQVKSLSPPVANSLTFRVRNEDGRYDPDNPDSLVAPFVDVGLLARYALVHAGVTHEIVRGDLDLLDPHPEPDRQDVAFGALSQLSRLVDKTGFSSPLYTDILINEAMHVVFDLAEIPIDRRAFDACDTVLPFFCVRPGDELFDLAIRLWASEGPGARLFDGKDGRTHLKHRYAQILESRSLIVQATYKDTDDGVNPWYVSWDPDAGEQNVVNACSVSWVQRAVDVADARIWAAGADIVLGPGEVHPVVVQPTGDDPIASVAAPLSALDYTVAEGTLAGAVFDRTSGAFVTVALTAGPGGAVIRGPTGDETDGLIVRGRLARVVAQRTVTNRLDTAVSRRRYGPKPFTLPTLPEIDLNTLQDFCDAVVGQYQAPRPVRTIAVPLVTDLLAASTLGLEIADRIRLVNAGSTFDRPMFVEGVRVDTQPGRAPVAYLGCEACHDVAFAFWDAGLWDVSVWAY